MCDLGNELRALGVLAGEPGFPGWRHWGEGLKKEHCEVSGREAKELVVVQCICVHGVKQMQN